PVGGDELECVRIEIDAPESTKKLKLFLESFKKNRFLVGKADMAARQLADEEGDLRLLQGLGPQGGQVVPKPGLAAAQGVVKPLAGPLFFG
ncbi:MAG: hypothetical protein ACK559_18825, partial [bacterium]